MRRQMRAAGGEELRQWNVERAARGRAEKGKECWEVVVWQGGKTETRGAEKAGGCDALVLWRGA